MVVLGCLWKVLWQYGQKRDCDVFHRDSHTKIGLEPILTQIFVLSLYAVIDHDQSCKTGVIIKYAYIQLRSTLSAAHVKSWDKVRGDRSNTVYSQEFGQNFLNTLLAFGCQEDQCQSSTKIHCGKRGSKAAHRPMVTSSCLRRLIVVQRDLRKLKCFQWSYLYPFDSSGNFIVMATLMNRSFRIPWR